MTPGILGSLSLLKLLLDSMRYAACQERSLGTLAQASAFALELALRTTNPVGVAVVELRLTYGSEKAKVASLDQPQLSEKGDFGEDGEALLLATCAGSPCLDARDAP